MPVAVEHTKEGAAHQLPLQCGDLVLTHGDYFFSKMIRFGQKLRYPAQYASWNHAALVLNEQGELAEALGKGVIRTHISKYRDKEYTVVHTNVHPHDQQQVLTFAENVLAARYRYGWRTIVSLFFTLAIGWDRATARVGTAICSGFYADALTRGKFIWPLPPFAMKPADLAKHFDAPAWTK